MAGENNKYDRIKDFVPIIIKKGRNENYKTYYAHDNFEV
jgi:hypothetical protein